MRKKIAAVLCALAVIVSASGCSGGSIYSNYRDIGQLLIIQTMGFDQRGGEVTLSVSAEGSSGAGVGEEGATASPVRLSVRANSLNSAQDSLQGYSDGRQLFFGHTSYIVLGSSVLDTGVGKFFDCIERDAAFRLSIPIFAVAEGDAETLVIGSGGSQHDATRLLRAVSENLRLQGSSQVYTAAQVIAQLNRNGAALICALSGAPADDADPDAQSGELAALPDGYIIIKDGAAAGRVPPELARAVSVIKNETGSLPMDIENTTVQLDKTSCTAEPVFDNGHLTGVNLNVELSAALVESEGSFSPDGISDELAALVKSEIEQVLELQISTGCDFLQLGNTLELGHPKKLRGCTRGFAEIMARLNYNVSVHARLDRSFHLDLGGGGE